MTISLIDLTGYKVGDTLSDQDQSIVAQCYGTSPSWYRLTGDVSVMVTASGGVKSLSATDGIRVVPLDGYTPSCKPDLVKAAFRAAIKGQVQQAIVDTVWPHVCPISGIVLNKANRASYHVDHSSVKPGMYPFSAILRSFLSLNKLSIRQVELDSSNRLETGIRESWEAYHRKHSDLVVVEARANMKKGAKLDRDLWK